MRLASLVRTLVSLALLGAGLMAIHYFLGHDPGGPCAQDFECRYAWNGVCLHGHGIDPYCSRKCKSQADCWSDWVCEPIQTELIGNGRRTVTADSNACVRPAANVPP
jgi:hypothetical protein